MSEPEIRSEKCLTQVDFQHKQGEGVRLCPCKKKSNASAILQLDRELSGWRFNQLSIFFVGEEIIKNPQMIVKSVKPHFWGIEENQPQQPGGRVLDLL